MTTRLLLALTVALALAFFEFGWRVELPPLPTFFPHVAPVEAAGGGGSDTECVLWADIQPWALTRCESWTTGEVCIVATSGFVVCKFGD